jgi:hypothetical protein
MFRQRVNSHDKRRCSPNSSSTSPKRFNAITAAIDGDGDGDGSESGSGSGSGGWGWGWVDGAPHELAACAGCAAARAGLQRTAENREATSDTEMWMAIGGVHALLGVLDLISSAEG